MKKILLLHTGGTIASVQGAWGLEPKLPAYELVRHVTQRENLYTVSCKTLFSLDSSNIQPEEWKTIAGEVFEGLACYDGIVVAHGTDTMAYTASMLSFMIRHPGKPIIFTGSQLPVSEVDSDAPQNISDALIASLYSPGGIFIVFGGKIIRGCRAVKVRTSGFDMFESINAPYLGYIKGGKVFPYGHETKPSTDPGTYPATMDAGIDTRVFLLKLIPGTNPEVFGSLLQMGYRGVVVEGFGLGGAHYLRRDLVREMRRLVDAGIAVVVTSQCLYKVSDLSVYEVGGRLLGEGIIPGRDMTSEAAVTKLMWILGHTADYNSIKQMFLTDFCGEIMM